MSKSTDQLLAETRRTFTQLAQDQGVSVPTVWRWGSRGIRGHVLESFNVGMKRFTTVEAFGRWIAKINGEAVTSRTNRQREREQNADRKAARDAGLLPA